MTSHCEVKRFCISLVLSVSVSSFSDPCLHEMEMQLLISEVILAAWIISYSCKPCQHFNAGAEFSFHKHMIQSQS